MPLLGGFSVLSNGNQQKPHEWRGAQESLRHEQRVSGILDEPQHREQRAAEEDARRSRRTGVLRDALRALDSGINNNLYWDEPVLTPEQVDELAESIRESELRGGSSDDIAQILLRTYLQVMNPELSENDIRRLLDALFISPADLRGRIYPRVFMTWSNVFRNEAIRSMSSSIEALHDRLERQARLANHLEKARYNLERLRRLDANMTALRDPVHYRSILGSRNIKIWTRAVKRWLSFDSPFEASVEIANFIDSYTWQEESNQSEEVIQSDNLPVLEDLQDQRDLFRSLVSFREVLFFAGSWTWGRWDHAPNWHNDYWKVVARDQVFAELQSDLFDGSEDCFSEFPEVRNKPYDVSTAFSQVLGLDPRTIRLAAIAAVVVEEDRAGGESLEGYQFYEKVSEVLYQFQKNVIEPWIPAAAEIYYDYHRAFYGAKNQHPEDRREFPSN